MQVYLAWSRENRCCSMWKFAHTPFLPDWICWVMIWVCVEVVDTNWWMAVTVWRNVGLLEAISCVREQVRTRSDRNREEKRSGMNWMLKVSVGRSAARDKYAVSKYHVKSSLPK